MGAGASIDNVEDTKSSFTSFLCDIANPTLNENVTSVLSSLKASSIQDDVNFFEFYIITRRV
jgi:hypothetical protein